MTVDQLLELPVTVDAVSMERRERETASDFTRATTVVSLAGDGETGLGEDVTYDADEHDALAETGLPEPELEGEHTLASFSARVGDLELFPGGEPDQAVSRNYRRWALESAALDLALRQAGIDLVTALGRSADPVRFVASTRLGDPPTIDRVEALRERVPGLEFKLDPIPEWDADLIDALAAADTVRILDLKGRYEGTDVDVPADPDLYERVVEAFPDAIIEDPALTADTRPLFEAPAVRERVSWDVPIHGLADVEALPWAPSWLNIKPSRFGSIASLLETLEHCEEHDIQLYGGGQFELDVGRGQLQLLASLYYPNGPNDVAPRQYNDPDPGDALPESPLEPPAEPVGFRWG